MKRFQTLLRGAWGESNLGVLGGRNQSLASHFALAAFPGAVVRGDDTSRPLGCIVNEVATLHGLSSAFQKPGWSESTCCVAVLQARHGIAWHRETARSYLKLPSSHKAAGGPGRRRGPPRGAAVPDGLPSLPGLGALGAPAGYAQAGRGRPLPSSRAESSRESSRELARARELSLAGSCRLFGWTWASRPFSRSSSQRPGRGFFHRQCGSI